MAHKSFNLVDELLHYGKGAPWESFLRDETEPAFLLIEPGGIGGCKNPEEVTVATRFPYNSLFLQAGWGWNLRLQQRFFPGLENHRFARRYVPFTEQLLEPVFDGVFGNVKYGSDFFIRIALH